MKQLQRTLTTIIASGALFATSAIQTPALDIGKILSDVWNDAGNNSSNTTTRQPSWVQYSIRDLSCEYLGALYREHSSQMSVGFQMVNTIAKMNTSFAGSRSILIDEQNVVVCDMAGNGELPSFRTAMFKMALSDADNRSKNSVVQLTVYLDGQYKAHTQIQGGKQEPFAVDVAGARSIALQVECIRTSDNSCPTLYFLQDSLSR